MIKNTLRQSLNLKLDLSESFTSDQPQIHLISIPHEILTAPSNYELTFSKINAWPVDIYARVLPSHLRSEREAVKFLNHLLQSESYFSALPAPTQAASISSSSTSTDDDLDDDSSCSSPATAANLFNKHAHSRGLDVEKLYFHVHSQYDHYLLVGIKAAGIAVPEQSSAVTEVYQSFPLQIEIQPVLLSVPWPFLKLTVLIAAIVISYFVLLRRYHLRLFGIK